MGNNRTVKIKIDKDLAIRADYLFYELGITMEQVISEYLKVAVDSQSLPIVSPRVPNAETIQALTETMHINNLDNLDLK